MRRKGQNSTGGTRARSHRNQDDRPAAFVPAPSTLSLLRGVWAKREHLTERERGMVQSFLERARTRALTQPQLDAAIQIGKSLGVGYDDPAFDDAPMTARSAQPWGPLPMKPPGRS